MENINDKDFNLAGSIGLAGAAVTIVASKADSAIAHAATAVSNWFSNLGDNIHDAVFGDHGVPADHK